VTTLQAGALAGEYVIEDRLASGGCGTVYVARHRVLERRVAVKVLHPILAGSKEMVERFVREARAASLIRHPSIVEVYEFGALSDGRPYFVMELLDGQSIEERLRERGPLALGEALAILAPLGEALQAAHDAGVVHRDVKGSNVVVLGGAPPRVKLLDFGTAKLLRPEQPTEASNARALGTPSAMAPEQILGGAVDARTDVYALAVLAFQMLTGRLPFESRDVYELERMHVDQRPPPPSRFAAVPPSVDAAILKALEKEAARRPRSVTAFLQALAADAPSPTRASSQPAVAVWVEGRMEEDAVDERVLADLALVLDAAARTFGARGWLIPMRTGSSLLAATLLPADPVEARRQRARALETVLVLAESVRRRPGADARLQVGLTIHADRAVVRQGAHDATIVGGPVMRIAAWVPADAAPGVAATRAALDGLTAPQGLVVLG
jgi:eukaryotic-like serine/threonine-protein kinase